MVKIRLARYGKKKKPYYRIIVTESTRARDATNYADNIGFYEPYKTEENKRFSISIEKYNTWIKKGAQPTERVKYLVSRSCDNK